MREERHSTSPKVRTSSWSSPLSGTSMSSLRCAGLQVPVAAYQVSGEYAMVVIAADAVPSTAAQRRSNS